MNNKRTGIRVEGGGTALRGRPLVLLAMLAALFTLLPGRALAQTTSIARARVTVASATYTGEAVEPAVTVTLSGASLRPNEDYSLSYANNVNVGTGLVTVSGQGSYSGSLAKTFRIARASLVTAAVELPQSSYVYTGAAVRPEPRVTLAGRALVAGADYSLSYSGNTRAGTATVIVRGVGNYTGTARASFSIVKASIDNAIVSLPEESYVRTGKAIKPVPTVTLGNQQLAQGVDYTVSYLDNREVGTATVIVRGKGIYQGSAQATFEILKDKTSISKARVSVASATYTGAAVEPEVTVTLGGFALKAGTDYELSYANNVAAGTGSAILTGIGDYYGTVTKTFRIARASLATASITLPQESYAYTGVAIRPVPVVELDGRTLHEGADYALSYSGNTRAGTATVIVRGANNYTGTARTTFAIAKTSLASAVVTLPQESYLVTGKAIRPVPTVVLDGQELVAGTDYTVTYANNRALGTATVTVRGKGLYADSAQATFEIVSELPVVGPEQQWMSLASVRADLARLLANPDDGAKLVRSFVVDEGYRSITTTDQDELRDLLQALAQVEVREVTSDEPIAIEYPYATYKLTGVDGSSYSFELGTTVQLGNTRYEQRGTEQLAAVIKQITNDQPWRSFASVQTTLADLLANPTETVSQLASVERVTPDDNVYVVDDANGMQTLLEALAQVAVQKTWTEHVAIDPYGPRTYDIYTFTAADGTARVVNLPLTATIQVDGTTYNLRGVDDLAAVAERVMTDRTWTPLVQICTDLAGVLADPAASAAAGVTYQTSGAFVTNPMVTDRIAVYTLLDELAHTELKKAGRKNYEAYDAWTTTKLYLPDGSTRSFTVDYDGLHYGGTTYECRVSGSEPWVSLASVRTDLADVLADPASAAETVATIEGGSASLSYATNNHDDVLAVLQTLATAQLHRTMAGATSVAGDVLPPEGIAGWLRISLEDERVLSLEVDHLGTITVNNERYVISAWEATMSRLAQSEQIVRPIEPEKPVEIEPVYGPFYGFNNKQQERLMSEMQVSEGGGTYYYYGVRHWVPKDGGDPSVHDMKNYRVDEATVASIREGSSVTPAVKSIEGFGRPSEQTITPKGSGEIVDYYYEPKQ